MLMMYIRLVPFPLWVLGGDFYADLRYMIGTTLVIFCSSFVEINWVFLAYRGHRLP